MTEVYWLEQTEADVPANNDWLSEREATRLDSLRFAKRRRDWRLGRWTAKLALATYRNLSGDSQSLRDVEIRPAPSGAPEVFLTGQPADVAISLSHRDGIAICAVAPSSVALGCDLELVEIRSDCFIADYFAAEEKEFVARACAGDRSRLLALLWSGKESALKALREGLRLDTRSVVVSLDDVERCRAEGGARRSADSILTAPLPEASRWLPFHVRCTSDQVFHGWWQNTENIVRTLVAAPPPVPPMLLEVPAHSANPSGRKLT
ncbi:MAG: 4'-phosphopantetheinyl transferase superfamily protein [Acidobacteriia bacterium]|nr:4'-phosphopantetheinyl transferase superfamily protein [Terriglobia bacterium]